MASPHVVTADRGDAGQRLDLVLRRHLHGTGAASRTRVQAWIAQGLVLVNGEVVRRVAARAAAGDRMTVCLPDAPPRAVVVMAAEPIELPIIYEDDDLLVVNKPAGMVVHPTYKHARGTVMNALLWRAGAWRPSQRPSIVGRLDKGTSGLVLAAKSAAVHALLQRALSSPRSEKSYLAVVHGRVRVGRATIDLPLARDSRDRRRVVVSPTDGAVSLTRVERLRRARAATLLGCRLVTGRMHQIRVHLAAAGWPIVGDARYGDPARDAPLRFARQALHAQRLSFVHPITRRVLTVDADPPDDFADLLVRVGLARPV